MQMVSEDALPGLIWAVQVGGLLLGVVFGFVTQRTRFCTLGAVSDWLSFGSRRRMKMWVLAMAVAIAGTQLLVAAGMLPADETFYASSRLPVLSHLLGGVFFGVGMVLAAGCGARTLTRIGEGSLKALVVLLVMALTAFMTIRGILASVRSATVDQLTVDLLVPQLLPILLGLTEGSAMVMPGPLIAAALGLWALWGQDLRSTPTPLWGSVAVGLMIVGGWILTGYFGHIEEHPQTLLATTLATNSRGPESLSFVGPPAFGLELLLYWSDRSLHASFGVMTLLGTVAGAFLSARMTGQFRWDGFRSVDDLARHLWGGVLMGLGGVMAMGCTIGQGLSGLSLLSLGAMLTLVGILLGAWGCIRWMERE